MKRKRFLVHLVFSIFLYSSMGFAQSSSVIDSLKQAVRTATSDSIKASAYANLSWNYAITRTKLDTARLYADSLKLLSIRNDDAEGLAKSNFYYGVIGRFKGDYAEALGHLQKFVAHHQNAGDSNKAASGLFQVGVVQKHMGNYAESLKSYYRILKIYRDTENLKSVGFTLNSIGSLQRKMDKFPEAIKSFKESIGIHEDLNDSLNLFNSLIGLGNTYRVLHDFENAKSYLFRALDIVTEINLPYGITAAQENLGNLYYEMGDYNTALEYHLESLSQREKLPSKTNLSISHNKVGNTYAKLNQTSLALENLLKSAEISEQIGTRPILEDTYKSLKQLYREIGNTNLAFKYQDLHMVVKDSILNSEKNKQLIEIETKYQTVQKDQKIALLTKENEVQQANAKQQKTFQNALMGGLLLLGIIAGLIFYALRSRLKNQKLLVEKNEEIRMSQIKEQLGTLEMKALRAQMNPHFLFNCMNSINRMIMEEENDKASKYLSKFSKLVRLMLENSENPKVTLKDELVMLKSYIELESIRFKNKMDYKIEVDKAIDQESTFIPSMVLQPFVENAIWHGLLHKDSKGLLTIAINEKGDNLHCTITDNGVGRDKSLKLQKQSGHKKISMGIKITTDRLKLLTKQKINDAIKILDLKDSENRAVGTQVDILIPIS